VKNIVISSPDKQIVFLGPTEPGSKHDYPLLKAVLSPDRDWFKNTHAFVDLGFQGIQKDYHSPHHIHIPHKKPRKSKSNHHPRLTEVQKIENRNLSSKRVRVEHAIGGMKFFHCLGIRFRNYIESFKDTVICLAAALWNAKLAY
jgi:hypothetical protein